MPLKKSLPGCASAATVPPYHVKDCCCRITLRPAFLYHQFGHGKDKVETAPQPS
jgi:hypothetical protein